MTVSTYRHVRFPTAWCHGAPGIGLAHLAGLPLLEDDGIRVDTATALQPGAVVRQGDTLGVVLPAGALRVVAYFLPAIALGRVQPGQPARLRLDGFPWAQYGSLAATVTSGATEARDGVIRVELQLPPETPTAIPLQHGLPGTVEVEVERISPAALVLRAVGTCLGVSTRRASTTGPQDGAS